MYISTHIVIKINLRHILYKTVAIMIEVNNEKEKQKMYLVMWRIPNLYVMYLESRSTELIVFLRHN